jgi:hypothetical protein
MKWRSSGGQCTVTAPDEVSTCVSRWVIEGKPEEGEFRPFALKGQESDESLRSTRHRLTIDSRW